MTRKEFLKGFILFFGGLLFVKEANLFKKIFGPLGGHLTEARFYREVASG